MSYVPYPGGTLLIPSDGKSHLFVILTKPCAAQGHLLVNVTSINPKKFHDTACVFAGGEHPFIIKPCYVIYAQAQQFPAATLTKCVDSGHYQVRDDLKSPHFENVCAGVATSDFTQKWVNDYYNKNKK